MTDTRRKELEEKLSQMAREMLSVVGEDLPEGGFVQITAWPNFLMVKTEEDWHTHEHPDDLIDYWEGIL